MNKNSYSELLIRLKSCRVISGFKSARLFANAFSIPIKTYSQHESGIRKISIDILIEYASYFRIDPYWLLTGQGFPSETDELNDAICKYLYNNYNIKLSLPKLYLDKKCQIDGKLITNVLLKLIDVVSKNSININCIDLVEFAYSVYNSLVDSSSDEQTKNNLIDLATKSLLTASQSVKIDTNKIKYP